MMREQHRKGAVMQRVITSLDESLVQGFDTERLS